MNCAPFDVAELVAAPLGRAHWVGRVFQLTVPGPLKPQRAEWPWGDTTHTWLFVGAPLEGVECLNDCLLRPIRDPATLEVMKCLLPKPPAS